MSAMKVSKTADRRRPARCEWCDKRRLLRRRVVGLGEYDVCDSCSKRIEKMEGAS